MLNFGDGGYRKPGVPNVPDTPESRIATGTQPVIC